tara:strand:- start:2249 stop:3790 length:1542 start_codon:yes stop_codon:yes gene_type:complete
MSYEVLARKYRPAKFSEVIGQDQIIQAISNAISSDRIHQAYIFSGTRGVGKTTIARILAKALNCESQKNPVPEPCNSCTNCNEIKIGRSIDFLEIDAASNTQVDKMRELIETVEYKPAKGRYKVYLIDEVHMLSQQSFNALLKTLEEPPPHVIFIFATTNPEKIPKTVQSRCLQLNLRTVSETNVNKHIKYILSSESIKFDEKSINYISESSNGSVRDALTLLDQAIAYCDGELNEDLVKELLGTIDSSLLFELINFAIDGDGKKVFDVLEEITELSPDFEIILANIISILHKVALEQVLKESDNENIIKISNKIDMEFCQLLYEIATNSYTRFASHPDPKEALEICLLRMLAFNPLVNLRDQNKEKKNLKKVNSPPKSRTKILLNNNNDWLVLFEKLKLSPFARTYLENISFVSLKNNKLILAAGDSYNDIPDNIVAEISSTISKILDKEINVYLEKIEPNDSPMIVNEKIKIKKNSDALNDIKSNKSIKSFLNKFDGDIVEDTIKPIEKNE